MRKSLWMWSLAALSTLGLAGSAFADDRVNDRDVSRTESTHKSESQKTFDTDKGAGQPDARHDASVRADMDKSHRTSLEQNKKQLHGTVQEVKEDRFTLRSSDGTMKTLQLKSSTAIYGAGERTAGLKTIHPGDEVRASFTGAGDMQTATEIHVLKSVDEDTSRSAKGVDRDVDQPRKSDDSKK